MRPTNNLKIVFEFLQNFLKLFGVCLAKTQKNKKIYTNRKSVGRVYQTHF